MEDLSINITIEQKKNLIKALDIKGGHMKGGFNEVIFCKKLQGVVLRISRVGIGLTLHHINGIYNSYSKRLSQEFKENEHLVNIYFYGYVYDNKNNKKNAYAFVEELMNLKTFISKFGKLFTDNDFLKTKLFLALLKFAKFVIKNEICDVKPDNTMIRLGGDNIFTFVVSDLDKLGEKCDGYFSPHDDFNTRVYEDKFFFRGWEVNYEIEADQRRIHGLEEINKLVKDLYGKDFSLDHTNYEVQLDLINKQIEQLDVKLKSMKYTENAELKKKIQSYEKNRKEANQKMLNIKQIFGEYVTKRKTKQIFQQFEQDINKVISQPITEASAVAVDNSLHVESRLDGSSSQYTDADTAHNSLYVNPGQTYTLDDAYSQGDPNSSVTVNPPEMQTNQTNNANTHEAVENTEYTLEDMESFIDQVLTDISNGTVLNDLNADKISKKILEKPDTLPKFQENIIKSIPIIAEIFGADKYLSNKTNVRKLNIELQRIMNHTLILKSFSYLENELKDEFNSLGLKFQDFINDPKREDSIELIESLIRFYELVPYKLLYNAIIEKNKE